MGLRVLDLIRGRGRVRARVKGRAGVRARVGIQVRIRGRITARVGGRDKVKVSVRLEPAWAHHGQSPHDVDAQVDELGSYELAVAQGAAWPG